MTTEKDTQNTDDYKYDERFDDKLMDHDYDGIKELDNPAPAWIMALFYVSIAIAVFYGAYYFWFGQGLNQEEEYAAENLAYTEQYKDVQQSSADLVLLTDQESLSAGAKIYVDMGCAACHGANGEGNAIGPNLVDNAWLNGCSFDEVFNIIKNGNPTKGMTAFKAQLSDQKIQQVSSYILETLKGTSPENAKDAQGTECK